MRLSKTIELAWNILVHSKLRSWLTIIGIIIGIGAVVSIVSISQGAQANLESQFGGLGADIITVSPGFSRASGFRGPGGFGENDAGASDQDPLTDKDILSIKSVPNVKFVMGSVSGRGEIKYLESSGTATVNGVDTNVWKEVVSYTLDSGRLLTLGDTYSVVLGYRRANSFFKKQVAINRQLSIEGRIFKVVGILAEGESDNSIFIPIEAARTILTDVEDDELGSITVQVSDATKVNETAAAIENKLMLSRGILKESEQDFTVFYSRQIQSRIADTIRTMAIFLGAIAAISLVVGAVGISNTMFTAVLEKTKEIGIMKAIGAKNRDILKIFLINSAMIGFVGGLGGIIVGSIASGYIGLLAGGQTTGGRGFATRIFSSTAITPQLLLIAFGLAIVIAMVAGAIPAYRASRLKPVDALRYE